MKNSYTYLISYEIYVVFTKHLKCWCFDSFRTTDDNVKMYQERLCKNKKVRNVIVSKI